MAKKNGVGVTLTPDVIDQIKNLATRENRNFSQQVEHLLARALHLTAQVCLGDVVATLRAAGVDEPTIANVTRGLVGGKS